MENSVIKSEVAKILLVFASGFAFNAVADGMTKKQYLNHTNVNISDFRKALQNGDNLNWNYNEACLAQAEGKQHTDNAVLFAIYKPSVKSDSLVKKAFAESSYAIRLTKCNGLELETRKACWDRALLVKTREVKQTF